MQKPAIFDLLDAAGQSGKNRPQALSPLLPVPGTPPTPNSPGNVRSPTAAAQILYTITPVRINNIFPCVSI